MPEIVPSDGGDSAPATSFADLIPGPTPSASADASAEPQDAAAAGADFDDGSADAPAKGTPQADPAAAKDDEEPEDPQAYMKWWKENFPQSPDPFAKYQNDIEFFQGMAELSRLIGQRDENAQLGKWLREQGVNEEEIREYLANRGHEKTPQTGKPDAAAKEGPHEFDMLLAQVFDVDGQAREKVSPAVVKQWGEMTRGLLRFVYDLKRDPKTALKEPLEEIRNQTRQDIAEYDKYTAGRVAEQRRIEAFRAANPWVLDAGATDGLSVQGRQLAETAEQIMREIEQDGGRMSMSTALQFAMDRLQAKQKGPPRPPVRGAARHKPNSAVPAKKTTLSDLIAKMGSLQAAMDYAAENSIDVGIPG